MATEALTIVVKEDGSRVVRRNLEDVGKAGQRSGGEVEKGMEKISASSRMANKTLDLLKTTMIALGTAAVLKKVGDLSDSFINLESRVASVVTGSENLKQAMSGLFDVANETRQSVESTAERFVQLTQATEDLGISQERILGATQTLNQALLVSAGDAGKAQSALDMLFKSMHRGQLDARALTGVLQEMPTLTQAMQREFGMTRSEIIAMAGDGRIGIEQLMRVLEGQRKEIAKQAGETVPTLGEAWTQVGNAMLELVSELTPAFIALARGIGAVAEGTVDLVRSMKEGFWTLNEWTEVLIFGEVRAQAEADAREQMTAVVERTIRGIKAATGERRREIDAIHAGIAADKRRAESLKEAMSLYGMLGDTIMATEATFEKLQRESEERSKASARAAAEWRRENLQLADSVERIREQMDPLRKAQNDLLEVTIALDKATDRGLIPMAERNRLLEEYIRLNNEALGGDNERTMAVAGDIGDPLAGVKTMDGSAGFQDQLDQLKQVREVITAPVEASGLAEALARVNEELMNTDKLVLQVVDQLTNGLTGVIMGTQTVEQAFRQMTQSILEELTRIIIKQLIVKALMAAIGGPAAGGGGIAAAALGGALGGGMGGLPGMATGGSWIVGQLPGFATGGSFGVGGRGGVDSQFVAFRATPGERVTVETPAQQARNDRGGGGAPSFRAIIVSDIREAIDEYMRSPAGEKAVIQAQGKHSRN